MKLLRISASLMAFGMITALAACGGGGGGGGTLPNPGGGGGGPTPKPSTSPTTSPTATPTPVQTATPTPTSSPSGSISANSHTEIVQDGSSSSPLVFGTDNWQKNGVTDSESAGDGDLAAGFTSSNKGPINGVTCTLGTEPGSGQYHVHSFVGIYVNGTQYAMPDAIGLLNPSGDGAGATAPFPNENFSQGCFMHTHSTSGVIHIEDTTLAQSFTNQPAQYNLQSLLDIWGQQSLANVAAGAVSGFNGPIAVYLGTPCANNAVGCTNQTKNTNGDDIVKTYTLQTAAPQNILLGHHVAIWIIAGPMPAAGLPAIDFGLSN